MSERTPEQILRGIEESEVDETIDRVLAMSDGERRRELEAAGVDLRDLRAAADALYDELHRASPGKPEHAPPSRARSSRPPPRRPPWAWALAVLGAVLLGLIFFADLLQPMMKSALSPEPAGDASAADGGARASPRGP